MLMLTGLMVKNWPSHTNSLDSGWPLLAFAVMKEAPIDVIDKILNHGMCFKTVLDNSGAYIDAQNKQGYTSLHIACCLEYREVVTTLLARGADPNKQNGKGIS